MKPYFKVKKEYTSDIFGYVNLIKLNLELDSHIDDVTFVWSVLYPIPW